MEDGRVIEGLGGPPYHMSRAHRIVGGVLSVVSPVGDDFDIWRYDDLVVTRYLEVFFGYKTFRFINKYGSRSRTQFVEAGGYVLTEYNVVDFLERISPDHVIISPVFKEVSHKLVELLTNLFDVSIDIQGFIRDSDDKGRIFHVKFPDSLYKMQYNVFKLSEDELDYIQIEQLNSKYIIVTNGREGAMLYLEDSKFNIPAYALDNVDETGSGDIFLYLFIFGLSKSLDPVDACIYASAYTSYILEGGGVPPEERIEYIRDGVRQLK